MCDLAALPVDETSAGVRAASAEDATQDVGQAAAPAALVMRSHLVPQRHALVETLVHHCGGWSAPTPTELALQLTSVVHPALKSRKVN